MKRCMQLIHLLLEYAERNATGGLLALPKFEGHTEEQIEYHASLCVEAGLLHCNSALQIISVTWHRHEELARWRAESSHNC